MKITPMDKSFYLFRCIHVGPLSPSNIEKMKGLSKGLLDRNKKFLARLTDTYGSCAMSAMEKGFVVAHARFYPQIIFELAGKEYICCQEPKFAPTQQMVEMVLPEMDNITDRTLRIHCWHVHKDYRSQGLSHALLDGILQWAQNHGWKVVRASAASDNYWVSSQACTLMLHTFIKRGFQKTKTVPSPELRERLMKFRKGEFGIEGKKEFEKFCGEEDLSKLAVHYEVECQL